jgi:hypothetical protein
MVSSKLKIKIQNPNKLFYSKFLYKAEFTSLGVRFIFRSKSIEDCIKRIERFNDNTINNTWYMPRSPSLRLDHLDLSTLKKVICFYKKYKDSKQVTFLRSGYSHNVFSMYTNDVSILEELVDICSDTEIIEAVTPPSEIMYFAKEPPYKYRIYLKNKVFSQDTMSSLKTFYMSNHDVFASSGLTHFVMQAGRRYLPSGCFIDYNDEQTLTMMHLLFGECLRKSYKLEKRP